MRYLNTKLASVAVVCFMSGCGGGGSDPSSQSLSADQAAFESMVLSPNSIYIRSYSLPSAGETLSSYHNFCDSSESLTSSPLKNGAQTVSGGPLISVANQANCIEGSSWYLVNGKLVKEPFPYTDRYSYKNGAIIVESIATDGFTVAESGTLSSVSANTLTGSVNTPPDEFKAIAPQLFSNPALLKTGISWQSGSAYLKYTFTSNIDSYYVIDWYSTPNPSAPGPFFSNAKLADKLSNSGLVFQDTTYTTADGRLSTINGILTYISNTPKTGTKYYTAFYEINGSIYVGSYVPAGYTGKIMQYNTAARNSLKNAINF